MQGGGSEDPRRRVRRMPRDVSHIAKRGQACRRSPSSKTTRPTPSISGRPSAFGASTGKTLIRSGRTPPSASGTATSAVVTPCSSADAPPAWAGPSGSGVRARRRFRRSRRARGSWCAGSARGRGSRSSAARCRARLRAARSSAAPPRAAPVAGRRAARLRSRPPRPSAAPARARGIGRCVGFFRHARSAACGSPPPTAGSHPSPACRCRCARGRSRPRSPSPCGAPRRGRRSRAFPPPRSPAMSRP